MNYGKRGYKIARRFRRCVVAAVAVTGLAVGVVGLSVGSASAAPTQVTDASFTWGLDATANSGAYYGGCNFLSAGEAGNNGSSTVWTQTTPTPGYAAQSGNVTIGYPNASGTLVQPTWSTKCDDLSGAALTPTTSSGGEVVFSGGTGTFDPAANTASIQWTGSFTSVFYGGLVYWTAANPTLTVNADGTGTLTANLSGYAASMTDTSLWAPIPATTVTLANLTGVTVTSSGFTVSPNYLNVAVTTAAGDSPQVQTGSEWGSWPQDFINFQNQTNESSYWYSSGLNDQDKVPEPLDVSFIGTAIPSVPSIAPVVIGQPANVTVTAGQLASFTAAASGTPTPTVQWQSEAPGSSAWTDLAGATGTTLTVPSTTTAESGTQYEAVFTNSAGTATSNPAALTVNPTSPPAKKSGYTLVGSDGGVFNFGSPYEGSLPGLGIHVNNVVGIVPSRDDNGYFLVGLDGGVFSFGDVTYEGSLPGQHVAVNDIVGIVPTADDRGYFLVGSDGGVFSFGDAPFLGSLPGIGVSVDDIVSISATADDRGYYLLGADGSIYAFGDAKAQSAHAPAGSVAIASDPAGGFWVVGANGAVTGFGGAPSFGSLPGIGISPNLPIVGLVPTSNGGGYTLIGSDGGVFTFGNASYVGSLPGIGVDVDNIVGAVPAT
jgi:hypothetical protein